MRPAILAFDRSLLPEAEFEFAVLGDTHYVRDLRGECLEFESRRMQTRRTAAAIRSVAALNPAFTIHMGDLVQTYPEMPDFTEACEEARSQLERNGLSPYVVAGNHDVGDKPDPTMPTHPVTDSGLEEYHAAHGPTWYSFDHGGSHFIVINSQILNQTGNEANRQQRWLERDLEDSTGKRRFLFLHLPPYLFEESEPHLGHYDNVGEPARHWLLGLVKRHQIEHLCAAHVHFAFYDRIGATAYHTVPSTSFSRPGFSHLFTSGPPPERGRDDTGKLGFFLLRVRADSTDVHLIRTDGVLEAEAPTGPSPARLLTRTSPTLPGSPIGLTLLHPLAAVGHVPEAFPSLVRQTVRNDYPLLACVELGVRAVRLPASDLVDPRQARRLDLLRAEGVSLVAVHLWSAPGCLAGVATNLATRADGWELQLPGTALPGSDVLDDIQYLRTQTNSPVGLSTAIPGDRLDPVKQHPRTRIGYHVAELPALDRHLEQHGRAVERVLCRIPQHDVWASVLRLRDLMPLKCIQAVDLRLQLDGESDIQTACIAAQAVVATALLPGARLYLEPLIDLDRTMDAFLGLLDTRCNPRAAFHTVRCLNSIVFGHSVPAGDFQPETCLDAGVRSLWIRSSRASFCLLVPQNPTAPKPSAVPAALLPGGRLNLYSLADGVIYSGTAEDLNLALQSGVATFPVLVSPECR